ncbi:hypothetical protein PG996_000064 [Apiospora saccharicola]|uniref:Velvet domain-containing protein n=1 Tax=Apiospora saccharicola TaxID=335842 RepID=A0ABR1WCN7_9PEZI
MPGMVIDIQPPSVARRGRVMRPQMVVSLPGDTVCSFVHCTIQTAGGAPVGDIMQGGTQANVPESINPPQQSTSSRPARRGRQYSIFFNLSIHEVGRFVITVHASCTNDEGGQYVDDVTSEVVEVIDGKVAKTKLDKHQEKLMDKLDNAGFFAS